MSVRAPAKTVAGFTGWSADVTVPLEHGDLRLTLHTRKAAVAVVGPSGAGKSTLLRILAGVEKRARGRVVMSGDTWLDSEQGMNLPPWARRVGWVPQEALLFPHLSVRDNLAYAAGAEKGDVVEMATMLEVATLLDRRPRRLSGGERQRVALGRALLSSPRLLLLDEPFSALDRPLRIKLARVVKTLANERSLPLVIVSHDEQDSDILADEQWHLADGGLERVTTSGT